MNINEMKEKIKKAYGFNDKTVEDIFNDADKKLQFVKSASKDGLTEEQLNNKRKQIISSMLIKKLNSNAKDFEAIFITDSGVRVKNAWEIEQKLKKYHQDPLQKEKMLSTGEVKIIKGEPRVMDLREELYGKKNNNYGKPMITEEYRMFEGIGKEVKEGEATTMKKILMKLKGNTLKEEIPLNKIVYIKASEYMAGDTPMLFLEAGTVKIRPQEVSNIISLMEKFYGDCFCELGKIEERIKAIDEKTAPRLVIVKGTIDSIDLGKEKPSIFLRTEIDFDKILEGGAKGVERVLVKVDRTFDGAPFSECLVLGDAWKFEELIGITAKGWITPEKAVDVEKVDIEQSSGDNEW